MKKNSPEKIEKNSPGEINKKSTEEELKKGAKKNNNVKSTKKNPEGIKKKSTEEELKKNGEKIYKKNTEKIIKYNTWNYIVGGVIGGILAAMVNNIIFFFEPMIFDVFYPKNLDVLNLSIFSFLVPLIASQIFYNISKYDYIKGFKTYIKLTIALFSLSIIITIFPDQLDSIITFNEQHTGRFRLLSTIPFHAIEFLVVYLFLPKFVTSDQPE